MHYFKILNCTKEPFPENPTEGLFAPISSHKNCLDTLVSSTEKQQNVINAVIGEATTGKTTLLYEFEKRVLAKAPETLITRPPKSWFASNFIFIQQIAKLLEIRFDTITPVDQLQYILQQSLIPTNQSDKKKHLICIDQAEKLPFHFLEVLDSLYKNPLSGRLQISLFGTSRFEDKLSQYQNLLQHTNFIRMPAKLSFLETKELATFHLGKAGSNQAISSLISPAGCYYSYLLSGGNPGKALQLFHLVILNLAAENRGKAGVIFCHRTAKDIFPAQAKRFAVSNNLAAAAIALFFVGALMTTADLEPIAEVSKDQSRQEQLRVEQDKALDLQQETGEKIGDKVNPAIPEEPITIAAEIEKKDQPTIPFQNDPDFDQVANIIARLETASVPEITPPSTTEEDLVEIVDNPVNAPAPAKTATVEAMTTAHEPTPPKTEERIALTGKTDPPAQAMEISGSNAAEAILGETTLAGALPQNTTKPLDPLKTSLPAVKVLNVAGQKTAVKKKAPASASPKENAIEALKTKKTISTNKLPSQFIGSLEINRDSTLGHMIRGVYGRNTVTLSNIKWLMKSNPHIKNPDSIQPGTIINFPIRAVRIPKGSTSAWWVKTGTFKTLKEAYSFLRQNTPDKPWLLILSGVKTGAEADFVVVVEQHFSNRKLADAYGQTLKIRGFKDLSVLNGLDPSKYYFKERE